MTKPQKNTDKERILIATTDGKTIYHQLSIIQSADGSFYCNLGGQPDSKDTHLSYHQSGQVNWHFWGTKETHNLVAPDKISRIFNFPGSVAHIKMLGQKVSYEDLKQFSPTKVVYIDLTKYTDSSINIQAFLLPPALLDYIKLPLIFGSKVSQIQIITDTNPWIGIEVVESKVSAEGPAFMSHTDRKSVEWINKLYLDIYLEGIPLEVVEAPPGQIKTEIKIEQVKKK